MGITGGLTMKGKHFIIFVHVYRPGEGARPESKNFGSEGRWNMQEEVYFFSNVPNKFLLSATAILDYDNDKVIKDRTGNLTPQLMLDHVQKNYPQQYKKFMEFVNT